MYSMLRSEFKVSTRGLRGAKSVKNPGKLSASQGIAGSGTSITGVSGRVIDGMTIAVAAGKSIDGIIIVEAVGKSIFGMLMSGAFGIGIVGRSMLVGSIANIVGILIVGAATTGD